MNDRNRDTERGIEAGQVGDPRTGERPSAGDAQVLLYQALCLVEDALGDGYRSRRETPSFEINEPDYETLPRVSGGGLSTNQETIAAIVPELIRCRACRLAVTRKQVVPGRGPQEAKVFILGEYPSDSENGSLPFSPEAGSLLDRMLAAIGLDRQGDCFETTAVKCRPPMNRDPAPDELSSCLSFLERQLLSIQPRAILAFGRISAQILLGSKDALPRFRGKVHKWRGIPLVATYHPAAILKDDSLKRPAWEDLKLLKTLLDHA